MRQRRGLLLALIGLLGLGLGSACKSEPPSYNPLATLPGSSFTFVESPGKTSPCPRIEACTAPYLELAKRHEFSGVPLGSPRLEEKLLAIRGGEVKQFTPEPTETELARLILEKLGLRPLLRDLAKTKRLVHITERWTDEDTLGFWLLIEDPLVGSWEAALLMPSEGAPLPALVAVHGHAEDAGAFISKQHGYRYPGAGYAILAHSQRTSFADEHEDQVARELLRAGSSLMAVRIYETLVGLELLRSLQHIDPARIALIGHSGGTLQNLLAVRLTDQFAAHVADGIGEYNSWDNGLIADETLPHLYPHSTQISRVEDITTPSARFEYGYPSGPEEVWAFLAETMPDRGPPPPP